MIPTLSWAPLKNSGFRSMGMSSVALLFVHDPGSARIKGFAFFGDAAMRAGTLPPAGHRADVTKTTKYSRFRANKKSRAFLVLPLIQRRLPPKVEGWKMGEPKARCEDGTRQAIQSR